MTSAVPTAAGTAAPGTGLPRVLTRRRPTGVAFVATAAGLTLLSPPPGRVLAAGWTAHAAWDAVHHRLDRVVPRWYAETCLVADLCLPTVLLTVGLV